jgi:hypothetical protein
MLLLNESGLVLRGPVQIPAADEANRKNAAVISLITVLVGAPFPGQNGFQRRRIQVGQAPLRRGKVGNAHGADLAVAPAAFGHPLHRIIVVERLGVGARLRTSRRFARAARIDAHDGKPARAPPLRIAALPVHVGIGFLLEVMRRHPQLVLVIDREIHDHRHTFLAIGPEHIGIDDGSVAHRNGHILLDDKLVLFRLRKLLLQFFVDLRSFDCMRVAHVPSNSLKNINPV